MRSLSKSFILTFLVLLSQVNSDPCSKYLVTSSAETFGCGLPQTYSASDFNIVSPNQYKQLAISFTYTPTSVCVVNTDNVILQLSIQPPNGGPRKMIMFLSYAIGSSTLYVTTEDTTGFKTFYSTAMAGFLNQHTAFYMAVDLTSTAPFVKFMAVANTLYTPPVETALVYDPSWVFDSSTKITVCAAENGSLQANCIIENLKVSFKIPVQYVTMLFSNIPYLAGDYKIDEGRGNFLANSQKANVRDLGDIPLTSANPPVWTQDSGIQFTSKPNQYIQVPLFFPRADDSAVTLSIGFGFYVRLDQAPATDALVFTYWCTSLATPIEMFNLMITPGRNLKVKINDASVQVPETIPLGEWTQLYVYYAFTSRGFGMSMLYINGAMTNNIAITFTAPNPSSVFSQQDTIRFGGGFYGQLKRLQIYSPAAVGFNLAATDNSCNPDTCLVEMGFSDPPTCMQTICTTPGTYSSFGTCEPCPSGCVKCTSPGSCKGCKPRFYSLGKTCPPCSRHCSLCTDFQTCLSCDPGYGLSNNQCIIICPAETYLADDQTCKKLSPAVKEALKNSQLINSGATQAANIISDGSAISLSAAIGGRIFSQIKYLNISYSGELQMALLTWLPSFVSLGLTPNMPESMEEKIPERHVPYVFEKYDVPSSFLRNFWESLGVVIFSTVLWLLFRGIEHFISTKTNPRLASIVRKTRTMTQNFLITALYGVYGDLVMFSIIEYRTLVFGWNLSLLSFLISVILLIAMFFSFFYQTKLLLTYQKLKKQNNESNSKNLPLEQFTKKHEGSQAYWKDFKDYSLAPQLFLFFLSGRDLIFSLILATMFEYPLPQTLIITLLDCLMLVYLFIKKPFDNNFDFAQQLFFEFIGLVVKVSVFINAILDAGKYVTANARINIGKLIIVCNMIFNFVTAVFMLIYIVQALMGFYKAFQEKRLKKLEALKIMNRVQKISHQISNPQANQSLIYENNISQNISFQHESFEMNLLPAQMQYSHQNPRLQKILRPPIKNSHEQKDLNHTNHQVDYRRNYPRKISNPILHESPQPRRARINSNSTILGHQ